MSGVFIALAGRAGADTAPQMIVPGKFAVSSTGAATYSIPIIVPPGTAGMVPSLALSYSSRSGDGFVGLGWALSGLPQITRCPRTIAQDSTHGGVNYDSNDKFCLDGQRLIVTSGAYGADSSQYRTEVDTFTKVIAHTSGSNGPDYFEVHLRNGTTMEFGNTTDSHVLAVGTSIARLWAVNKIMDSAGNYLTVTYNCTAVSSACTDTSRTSNGEVYPLRIDYTGNAGTSLSPYNSVQFTYATRPDIIPKYHAGSLVQPDVRLTDIKTYQSTNVVFDYQLAYYSGGATARSRLISVTQCDGSSHCLAPTTFGWQGGTALPTMTGTSIGIAQGVSLVPGDFNGDGLTDVMVNSGTYCGISLGSNAGTFSASSYTANYTYWDVESGHYTGSWQEALDTCFGTAYTRNGGRIPSDFDGNGFSDAIIQQKHSASGFYLHPLLNNTTGVLVEDSAAVFASQTPIAIADFNGDGRSDVLARLSATGSYQIDTSSGPGNAFGGGATYSGSLTLLTGDFDGDGCADILRSSSPWTVDYSCSPKTSTASISTSAGAVLTVGDFNGDGMADILVTYPSSTGTLYLSTGNGFTATSFSVPSGWGSYTIVVGDWNGDGMDDIALISPSGTHTIYLSTGTGFTSATTISNSDTNSKAIVADWNNDGAEDIWLQRASGDELFTFAYVPELMTSVSNGLGATTTITYDRINQNGSFYSKGSSASYPIQDLDGPLYVVKEIDSSNGVGGTYTTTYTYGTAQVDLSGRGFLGFGSLAVADSQTGITETTTYNQTFPYTGLIASQTAVHSSTTLSSVTNTYHDDSTNCGVAAASGTYFVCLTQSVVAKHDLDGTALPSTTTAYTSFDAYGNPGTITTTVTYGGSTSSTATVSNTYSNDTTHWILGLVTASSVNRVVGSSNLTRSMSFAYNATTGLMTQSIVEPSNCEVKLEADFTLDSYGNRTATQLSGAGCSGDSYRTAITTRTSYVGFDTLGEFATSTTNALSQSDGTGYSAAFGLPTSHSDLNSHSTSWSYDYFGRMSLETRPDGTKTSTSYAYCSGVNGGSASCPTYGAYVRQVEAFASDGTTQIGPIVSTYFDALNRIIASDMQAYSGSVSRVATVYDSKGRINETSRPYFTSGGTAKWTVNTYDDLGRVTQSTYPDSHVDTQSYSGLTSSITRDYGGKNQTTSTTLNPQGLVASVTDAASNATSYTYDAFGHVLTVTDPSSNVITNAYDIRGKKTDSYDPDMGHWTYVSDVLGELKSQVDAKSQTTSLSYDLLGRPTERDEAGSFVSNWVYDSATYGVGLLQKACTSSSSNSTCSSPTTNKVFTYDSTSRPSTTAITVDSSTSTFTTTYNATNGAIDTVASPSGLTTKDFYNSYGYLCRITDNGGSHSCSSTSDSHVLWTANSGDAELHLLSQTAGNGAFSTTQTFDANTGLLTNVRAGTSDAVAAFDYTYDVLGNLTYRSDNNVGVYERFCYDNLNRLTNSATASTTPTACTSTGSGITSKTVAYNAIGNITSKSDVGTYSYPSSGGGTGSLPHAISSITGTVNGVTNPSYTYDSNGNMTAGAGRSVTYTAFNMAATITQGSTTIGLTYDAGHMRIKQCVGSSCGTSTTYYLNDPASGAMVEEYVAGGTTTWHDFLKVGSSILAERFYTVGGSTTWSYFVLDHLGSIAVLTDSSGSVSQRLSYDAWGRRRNSDGTDNSACSITSATTRGYTGHEMLDSVCEINANARVYDPTVGRFMTPDPFVQNPWGAQGLNRYSYVENGPLSATDPSGYLAYGCPDGHCLQTSGGNDATEVSNVDAYRYRELVYGGDAGPGGRGIAGGAGNGGLGEQTIEVDVVNGQRIHQGLSSSTMDLTNPMYVDPRYVHYTKAYENSIEVSINTFQSELYAKDERYNLSGQAIAIAGGSALAATGAATIGLLLCSVDEPCAAAGGLALVAGVGGLLGGTSARLTGMTNPNGLLVASLGSGIVSAASYGAVTGLGLTGGWAVSAGAGLTAPGAAAANLAGQATVNGSFSGLDYRSALASGTAAGVGYVGGGAFALDVLGMDAASTAGVVTSLNGTVISTGGELVLSPRGR
ncbi:MAG: VCBS repeat-containing protein [Alphaproteobacteria bacterium]|nr:VCBS repeat-containing protein [Alphaproteobacteria bacterium]